MGLTLVIPVQEDYSGTQKETLSQNNKNKQLNNNKKHLVMDHLFRKERRPTGLRKLLSYNTTKPLRLQKAVHSC